MNSSPSIRVQGEPNSSDSQEQSPTIQATILKLLRKIAGDTSLASEFSQVWTLHQFQLGDEVINCSNDRQVEVAESANLYLVCTGKVRLLSYEATQQRWVSIQLLEGEQAFGGDRLFDEESLPYQAVAASNCHVASISISQLLPWLERLPSLADYLLNLTEARQALIFLKADTELRELTSNALKQLLPYFLKKTIPSGSTLAQATPPVDGRFWLKAGTVISQDDINEAPTVGDSWGYPEVTLPNWIAQTDLSIYHLPVEHWSQVLENTPVAFKSTAQSATVKEIIPASSVNNLTVENENAPRLTKEINFPQPSRYSRSLSRLWRRYPFIQQQSSSDCGAACLAMVCEYWGQRFSMNSLRSLAHIDRMGATLKGLADAAEILGFHASAVRGSLNQLESVANPWIAHWEGVHYVVVWRVKGDRVLISDPALGRRNLSRREFEASWTEYALLLSPMPRLFETKTEKLSLKSVIVVFWHYRQLMGQILFASALIQLFGLTTPILAQLIFDQVLLGENFSTLNLFAGGWLILGAWRIIFSGVRQYLLDYFANRIDLTLIAGFVSQTLRLPLEFFVSRQVGDVIARIQENQKIQQFFTRKVTSTSIDALMVLFYLVLMAYYNLRLTSLVILLILAIVFLTIATGRLLANASRVIFQEAAEQNSAMVEMIAGAPTLKALGAEARVRWRWEERFTNLLKAKFRGQKLANNLHTFHNLIYHLGSTTILWYGADLVIRGILSVGEFVAFVLLIGCVINPISGFLGLWDEYHELKASLDSVNDVYALTAEENPQVQKLQLPRVRGEVHFENVTFRYHPDLERNTLQNISFTVKAGQTVGIVGRSGSGKTTLVNLLACLYRTNNGRILIDGHDISLVSPHSLRSQLGMVPQESFLFSGTVLENITLFDQELDLETAIAAAKLAGAHSFIQALPLGYHTQLGDRGKALSGGQRQRIAIARALVNNPRILIFDEATSALDTESERRIRQNLQRFFSDRTTIIVSHRLESVRHADCIFVLDRGILVESGTHEQLMALRGLYYHLAQQQIHL